MSQPPLFFFLYLFFLFFLLPFLCVERWLHLPLIQNGATSQKNGGAHPGQGGCLIISSSLSSPLPETIKAMLLMIPDGEREIHLR